MGSPSKKVTQDEPLRDGEKSLELLFIYISSEKNRN
jgi:hypothetical protein